MAIVEIASHDKSMTCPFQGHPVARARARTCGEPDHGSHKVRVHADHVVRLLAAHAVADMCEQTGETQLLRAQGALTVNIVFVGRLGRPGAIERGRMVGG